MSVTTRARCDWSVQSPIKRGENRRRFSPSLLMVKEESDCKGERGKDNGVNFRAVANRRVGTDSHSQRSTCIDFYAANIDYVK